MPERMMGKAEFLELRQAFLNGEPPFSPRETYAAFADEIEKRLQGDPEKPRTLADVPAEERQTWQGYWADFLSKEGNLRITGILGRFGGSVAEPYPLRLVNAPVNTEQFNDSQVVLRHDLGRAINLDGTRFDPEPPEEFTGYLQDKPESFRDYEWIDFEGDPWEWDGSKWACRAGSYTIEDAFEESDKWRRGEKR